MSTTATPRLNPSAFMGSVELADGVYKYLARWLPKSGALLDIGCGRGRFLQFAEGHGLQGLGVDNDEWSVAYCGKVGVNAVQTDIWAFLEEGTSNYDVISAIHFIEHFSSPEALRCLIAASKRLRQGGRLILVTPNFKDWNVASEIFWLDSTHVRPYPLALLAGMCEEAGLAVVHQSTEVLIDLGLKRLLQRPFQRLRFGREFDRMNAVLIAERPDAPCIPQDVERAALTPSTIEP